jgi:hypothetical protein
LCRGLGGDHAVDLEGQASDIGAIHFSPEAIANGVLYSISPPMGTLKGPTTRLSRNACEIGHVSCGIAPVVGALVR